MRGVPGGTIGGSERRTWWHYRGSERRTWWRYRGVVRGVPGGAIGG